MPNNKEIAFLMTPQNPLLSIVVPTKNRADTAKYCIRNCLSISSDNLEIIVHDCSDNDELETIMTRDFQDKRLAYYHIRRTVSMTENWNLAMEKIHGEYILYLGDDDGIIPQIIDVAEWARQNEIEAVSTFGGTNYFWGSYPEKHKAGVLFMRHFTGKIVFPDAKKEFNRYLPDPIPHNYSYMPNIYGGFVHYTLMKEICSETGNYFDSTNLDYYVSLMLLPRIKKYAVIDYPLIISGRSGVSNSGGRAFEKKNMHTIEYTNYAWPEVAPKTGRSYIGNYIEAKYTAYKNLKRDDLIKKTDFPYGYAIALIDEPKYRIQELLRQYQRSLQIVGLHIVRGWVFLLLAILRIVAGRVFIKIRTHFISGKESFQFSCSATDTQQATIKLVEYLKDCRPALQEVLKGADNK